VFNKLISNQQDPFEDQSTRAGKKEVRATSAIKVGRCESGERRRRRTEETCCWCWSWFILWLKLTTTVQRETTNKHYG